MARVEALSMSGATAIPAEYVRPQEERQGLGDAYDEAAASCRLAGSAGEDGKREWEDYLFHMLHPDARADHALWPAHPPEYVPVTKAFGEHVSALSSRLLAILSLGLGVPSDTLERRLRLTSGEAQVEDDLLLKLKINYYPRCPQPELAVGVEAHTDVSALSFILTNGVPGLQVLLIRSAPVLCGAETPRFEPRTFRQHLERKVLKKTNDQEEEEVVKKPPVVAQEEEKEVVKKPPAAGEEEEKGEATEPLVAGEEEHKVVKKEQSEQEEAKMAPVAANLVEVN
uniref:Isopenicillin N synthase-like Fe(2+) 2OG dioxygenase domain-containing protein n=1 Tax=Aegilops tauschii TaxID=37682 RepID=R7W2M0_AEGTA